MFTTPEGPSMMRAEFLVNFRGARPGDTQRVGLPAMSASGTERTNSTGAAHASY